MYFGLLLATGVFFIFIAFTMFLPVMVLMPQKFALCFTIGCALIIGSFFALKGPKNQLEHMTSKEVSQPCSTFSLFISLLISYRNDWTLMLFWSNLIRHFICIYTTYIFHALHSFYVSLFHHLQRLPFTLGFIGTMVGTIYVSMMLHSYILSVLFSVLQVAITIPLLQYLIMYYLSIPALRFHILWNYLPYQFWIPTWTGCRWGLQHV